MKKVILCGESSIIYDLLGITDFIKSLDKEVQVEFTPTPERAVASIPESSRCLVITDVYTSEDRFSPPNDSGAFYILREAAWKNDRCWVILFAVSTSLENVKKKEEFYGALDALDENSLVVLQERIMDLIKS